jgi:hypothetical protein
MKKQTLLFSETVEDTEEKYTSKIEAPVYEPKHEKPHLLILCDPTKAKSLISKINESTLPEDEKEFLRMAATRHIVFNYERIADYYAHSDKEMQHFMEDSALVIIDFEKAIEDGYIKLCQDIKEQYMEEYINE